MNQKIKSTIKSLLGVKGGKINLHAVVICAGLPLIGLSACAKKHVKTDHAKSLQAVALNKAGYLQFRDMQSFDSVLMHYNKVHERLPGDFAGKKLAKNTTDDWARLKALFSQDSLLAVGEDLYRLEAGKVYKNNLNQTDAWVQVRELVNLSEINATVYLPKCSQTHLVALRKPQQNLLAKDIADIEDFIVQNNDWFLEFQEALKNNKTLLENWANQGTPEQKYAAELASGILHVNQNLQQAKQLERDIAKHPNQVSYFNALYKESKQKTHVQGKSAIGIIGAVFSGLTGITNAIMDGLKPDPTQTAVNGMNQLAQTLTQNALATLNAVLAHNQALVNSYNGLVSQAMSNQQAQIDSLFSLLTNLLTSTSFSPTGNGGAMHDLLQGGGRAPLILAAIAQSGVAGTQTESLAKLFGDLLPSMNILPQAETATHYDLQPITRQSGYDYYYFYFGKRYYYWDLDAYRFHLQSYVMRTDTAYTRAMSMLGTNFEVFAPAFTVRYKNALGAVQTASTQLQKNSYDFPDAYFQMPRTACIVEMGVQTDVYSSRLFTDRASAYQYQNNLLIP
jgi:hypothetical protein